MARKSKVSAPPTTSSLFRVSKLLATAGSIAVREISQQILNKNREQTKKIKSQVQYALDIVSTLSQLKGAALKAGQMLSLELSDLLPKEVNQVLSSMSDDVSFMDIQKVKKILKKELGMQKFANIEQLSEEPIAAASIGQVHSALIHGQRVAIKIQYPNVNKTIDSDLKILQKILQNYLKFTKKDISLDDTFNEIGSNLKKETDYKLESQSLKKYKDLFKDYPQYLIPDCLDEYSTNKILTMTLEDGVRIKEYLESSNLDSNALADLILTLVYLEFFKFGLVQTDPNLGNFLIKPDSKKLILLDLGSNKEYDLRFRQTIIELLRISLYESDKDLLDYAFQLKLLDRRETEEVQRQFVQLMHHITSMYKDEQQPFDFGSTEYLKVIRQITTQFIRSVKYTSPAKELLFLNRKLGGMFHILKDARAKVDLKPYWQRVQKQNLSD